MSRSRTPLLLLRGTGLGSYPLGYLHAEIARNAREFVHYRVMRVVHYKEKTKLGHEFLVIDVVISGRSLDNSSLMFHQTSEVRSYRLERRPSTRVVALSSSESVTDDTITPLDTYAFQPEIYHCIATIFCTELPALTMLAVCQICTAVRDIAPIYSVAKARHCFWYCAAFLVSLEMHGYVGRHVPEEKYRRQGKVLGFITAPPAINEKAIAAEMRRQTYASVASPAKRPTQYPFTMLSAIRSRLTIPGFGLQTRTEGWRSERTLEGHSKAVSSVAFLGLYHVVSGSRDMTLKVWNTSKKSLIRSLAGHTGAVTSIATHASQGLIVSGSEDCTVRVWDVSAGVEQFDPLTGHTQSVTAVCFSSDYTRVISASEDGTIKIWPIQVEDSQPTTITGAAPFTSVSALMEGHLLAAGSTDCSIHIWDVADLDAPKALHSYNGHSRSITALTFCKYITGGPIRVASCTRELGTYIWDAGSGKLLDVLYGHKQSACSLAFSADGQFIASGSEDNTIVLWDVKHLEHILCPPLRGHTDDVNAVAFSWDGKRIVSGSSDKTVRIWLNET